MGDILEARVGALYRDSGDVSRVCRLFEPARAWIDAYALNPASKHAKPHPKSALIERLAKAGCFGWSIEKVDPTAAAGAAAGAAAAPGAARAGPKDSYGAQVVVHGAVLAGAVGRTPHIAERAACELGLGALDAWDRGACTCRAGGAGDGNVDASRAAHSPRKRARDAGPDPVHAAGVAPPGSKKKKKSSHSPQAA